MIEPEVATGLLCGCGRGWPVPDDGYVHQVVCVDCGMGIQVRYPTPEELEYKLAEMSEDR